MYKRQALESADTVQFHCYDCIDIGLIDASFENRMNFITHNVPRNHCIKHVTTDRVYKHEEALDIHHNANLANGYEGSILRTNDAYACKRSHNLRKFKDFSDAEALIVTGLKVLVNVQVLLVSLWHKMKMVIYSVCLLWINLNIYKITSKKCKVM